jgi:hypothetical protein
MFDTQVLTEKNAYKDAQCAVQQSDTAQSEAITSTETHSL